jgi:hypothetical protein
MQWCEDKQGKKHGIKVEYYYEPADQPRSEDRFEHGRYLGRKKWYKNGKLESDCGLNEHGRHNSCQEWFPNGQKRLKATYQDGKLHGLVQARDQKGHLVGEGRFENNFARGRFKYQFSSEIKPTSISLIGLEVQESHLEYPTSIVTDKFEVLDIDMKKGLAAFRHIYQTVISCNECEEPELVNCQYAGMQEFPTSGVILGVYDLTNRKIMKFFVVYSSEVDKASCTSHSQSKQLLSQAKDLFKNLGLDIKQRPKPIKPKTAKTTSTDFAWQVGDQTHSAKWLYDSYSYTHEPTDDPVVNMYADEFSIDHSVSTVTFFIDDWIAYKRYSNDYLVMGGQGKWQLLGVYRKQNRLVVVDRYTFGSGLGDHIDVVVFSEVMVVE